MNDSKYKLAADWDRMPIMLGRWRDTLSLASDDDAVIIAVEFRTTYVKVLVSPPDRAFKNRCLIEETIAIPVAPGADGYEAAKEASISEAKSKALAAYAAWCATHGARR